MSIEKYLPEIQERLRRDYPWFQRGKLQEIAFQAEGAPLVNWSDRFDFAQRDKRTGVVVTPNAVALHTNKYTSYEVFEDEIKTVLSTIHEIVTIGPVERIGLRYVNLVRLKEEQTWSDYLRPGLLGLSSAAIGVDQWISRSESIGKTSYGTLAVRFAQSENPLPPDLTPLTLNYERSLLNPKEIGAILDFDHYSEKTRDFDLQTIVDSIGDLHDNLDLAFRAAVTETALRNWE